MPAHETCGDARVQRGVADAQRGPELGLAAGLSQQRQSEYGASTRMFDVIGGNRQALAERLRQVPSGAQAEQIATLKLPTLIL